MSKELIVKWKIKEPEIPRILTVLAELAAKTREEEGNISYAVYQSESDPSVLILHERYADAAAVEAHRKSIHYQKFVAGEIVPHLESREVIEVKSLL